MHVSVAGCSGTHQDSPVMAAEYVDHCSLLQLNPSMKRQEEAGGCSHQRHEDQDGGLVTSYITLHQQ